jgi:hypothetical protein
MRGIQEIIIALQNACRMDSRCQGIVWEYQSTSKGQQEGYKASFEAGKVHLQADTPLAIAYGISRTRVAVATGHLTSFLGERQPRYAFRCLWVVGEEVVSMMEGVHIT